MMADSSEEKHGSSRVRRGPARPILLIVFTLIVIVAGVSMYVWRLEHRELVLEVHIFSLKGGRSMLVRTPDDVRVLIDGGLNSEVIRKMTRRLPFYSRRLDAIVMTDGATKNVTGLVDVLERYQVSRVYVPAVWLADLGLAERADPALEAFMRKVEEKGVRVQKVGEGDEIFFGEVAMEIIFPANPDAFSYSKASPPELLFEIRYGATSIVFLGSATTKVQRYVMSSIDGYLSEPFDPHGLPTSRDGRVLVVSHGATQSTLLPDIVRTLDIRYVVYARAPIPAKKSTTNTKAKIELDPLLTLMSDQRFNIKERGDVRIVSDKTKTLITSER